MNQQKLTIDEVTTERKVPFLKRLSRSFRHTFPSFRTGINPQQRTPNDTFMVGQLGEFVQSCKETTLADTGVVDAIYERGHENQQDWERLGAKQRTSKATATAPPPYAGSQEDLLQEKARKTRDFNTHLDKAGPLLNYNRDSEEKR